MLPHRFDKKKYFKCVWVDGYALKKAHVLHCGDRVSSCNIYAVQQDTQNFLMIEFIHHIC